MSSRRHSERWEPEQGFPTFNLYTSAFHPIQFDLNLHVYFVFIIAKYAKNPDAYFVERIYKVLDQGGTSDNSLIRLIVSHSEVIHLYYFYSNSVSINYEIADLSQYKPKSNYYDAAAIIFLHLNCT